MRRVIYKTRIESGVRVDDNNDFIFDYDYDLPSDLIDIIPPQLYQSNFNNHVYWFGYKFNNEVDSKQRTAFINYIKGLSKEKISDFELKRFIEMPLNELNKQINLYAIDAFVHPVSNRSSLVKKMVQIINNMTSREMERLTFELVKKIPTEIEFDWKLFDDETAYDVNRYNQMRSYVEDTLLPAIHDLDYFSLAHEVKSKYRRYIKNFLSFKQEDLEKFAGLQGKNILIIDDINTSGSTLNEVLRIIEKLNSSCNIWIYTLIGKE